MILSSDKTWGIIKKELEGKIENAMSGLTHMDNTHEKDLAYKARIAVCKELLNLPQTLETFSSGAANQSRIK